jgi:signal transduction histidine kinase
VTATQSDGTVAVSVADTGPGVLPEFRDRLFEPFFRLTPAGEGYGLGLAIAAKAVAAMRGEIDVSSSPGAGTTFTVRLPAATVVT